MPSPAWEDLAEFLDEDDFAVPAVIHLQSGGQVSLSVLFDDPDANPELGDAYSRDDSAPYVTCDETRVTAVKRGDTITLTFPNETRTYDVLRASESEGTGTARVYLSRQ